jgi:hypothetical protein
MEFQGQIGLTVFFFFRKKKQKSVVLLRRRLFLTQPREVRELASIRVNRHGLLGLTGLASHTVLSNELKPRRANVFGSFFKKNKHIPLHVSNKKVCFKRSFAQKKLLLGLYLVVVTYTLV